MTFVQLSIGMATFGLVAGTIFPGYVSVTERARLASIKANMYEVRLGTEHYAADHYWDHYPYSLIGYSQAGLPIKETPSRIYELHN